MARGFKGFRRNKSTSSKLYIIKDGVLQSGFSFSGNSGQGSGFYIIHCRPYAPGDGATTNQTFKFDGKKLHIKASTSNVVVNWHIDFGNTAQYFLPDNVEHVLTGGTGTTSISIYLGDTSKWWDVKVHDLYIS